MNAPRYASLAAKVLARDSLPVPTPKADARARAISGIEQALTARALRRRRMRWGFGLSAAAAVAAAATWFVGFGQHHAPALVAIADPSGGGAHLLLASGSEPLRSGLPQPFPRTGT